MGLNLDIDHVAFAGLVKFDGRRHRHLDAERAGADRRPRRALHHRRHLRRHRRGRAARARGGRGDREPPLPRRSPGCSGATPTLDFATPEPLVASLEAPADHPDLQRAREADDLATLKELARDARGARPAARRRRHPAALGRLPDPRLPQGDARRARQPLRPALPLPARGGGGIPTDWLARQIARIDRTDGDIDALSKRLAYIRTWTYVAQRRRWVDDADHWRDETRAVEDRLSDALHVQLTQRFVDRRTSVLMRRLKQRESLVATVTENGEVSIDDQFIGRLEGFRFRLDPSADADQARTLRAAGVAALAPALSPAGGQVLQRPRHRDRRHRAGRADVGRARRRQARRRRRRAQPAGRSPSSTRTPTPQIAEKVKRRLGHWIDRRIAALFAAADRAPRRRER